MNRDVKSQKKPTRAGGIIFDENNNHIVLVLNKDSYMKKENKWGLPKGHLTDIEKHQPHMGAIREIWEETGIWFPIKPETFSIAVYDTLYYVLKLNKEHNPLFKTNDTTEIIDVQWIPIKDLSKLNVNRTLAKIIKKWKSIFPNITHNIDTSS
tara:strand:+ start:267 stop:725 length:459 start_codon:yes stop_codon:yes gene_type:complete